MWSIYEIIHFDILFLGSHLDLSTHCYWLVKKAIVNFPIRLKLNFDTPLRQFVEGLEQGNRRCCFVDVANRGQTKFATRACVQTPSSPLRKNRRILQFLLRGGGGGWSVHRLLRRRPSANGIIEIPIIQLDDNFILGTRARGRSSRSIMGSNQRLIIFFACVRVLARDRAKVYVPTPRSKPRFTARFNCAVWSVPYTCAQPYHLGSEAISIPVLTQSIGQWGYAMLMRS